MKKIMILGASILQIPAIEKALQMGLEVVAVDMNPRAVGFSIPGVKQEIISTIDTPAVLKAAKQYQIDGIMTLASDMPMQTVAVVCEEMNLRGINRQTAIKATNKAAMRDALKEADVPIPAYAHVFEKEEFLRAVDLIQTTGKSCIVKPVDNSGSRGVSLIGSDSNLSDIFDYTKKNSRSGRIIVEEYMEGPEVSVETIAVNGTVHVIQITDKITTGAPYFVEMGHSQPSRLDLVTQKRIMAVVKAANQAIGIKDGPSHTEVKVTSEGPKIVELGARLGGDCITSHLVPLSTGVDMVECCIKIALGERPNITRKWNRGSAIRYLKTNQGVLKCVEGVEKAKAIPGVVQVVLVRNEGEMVGEIKSSADRVGFVIAEAANAEQAIRVSEDAVSVIYTSVG